MEQETLAQEALRVLSAIPSKEWMTGSYGNGKDKCCGVGHWCRYKNDTTSFKQEEFLPLGEKFHRVLINYTDKYIQKKFNVSSLNSLHIAQVNDNRMEEIPTLKNKYPQKTPKGRVIAFLKDMVKDGY